MKDISTRVTCKNMRVSTALRQFVRVKYRISFSKLSKLSHTSIESIKKIMVSHYIYIAVNFQKEIFKKFCKVHIISVFGVKSPGAKIYDICLNM